MAGRHGGRASDRAGARDTGWISMRYGTFRGLEIGKIYTFEDGRKGKVIEKRENRGQKGGLPMVKVEWRT